MFSKVFFLRVCKSLDCVAKGYSFADKKSNVAMRDYDRMENIVGKVQNSGYNLFLLFPTVFSKRIFRQGC